MSDEAARAELQFLLRVGNAHMPFREAVREFPPALINVRPPNVAYTFWHLVEHIRITQRDILDFIADPGYVAPAWPTDYWPQPDATATDADWDRSVAAVEADTQALEAIVMDPATDLYARLPNGTGQTVFREALVVADHNAYHVGELAILRGVMNAWPEERSE